MDAQRQRIDDFNILVLTQKNHHNFQEVMNKAIVSIEKEFKEDGEYIGEGCQAIDRRNMFDVLDHIATGFLPMRECGKADARSLEEREGDEARPKDRAYTLIQWNSEYRDIIAEFVLEAMKGESGLEPELYIDEMELRYEKSCKNNQELPSPKM